MEKNNGVKKESWANIGTNKKSTWENKQGSDVLIQT